NNTTTPPVGSGAVISGNTVTLLANVQDLDIPSSSTANAFGLIAVPHAESHSNVASTAKVLIGGPATQITGLGGVDIQALHQTFKPNVPCYASWNTIHTPGEEHPINNNSLHSHIVADAGATVVAGPPPGNTLALNVAADQNASITSGSGTSADPTIQWDANVTVAAGPSPH